MESESLNPLLENYKRNVIKDTVKKIYETYSIYDKGENLISENEIIGYLKKLNTKHPKKRCCGISTSTIPKRCTKSAIDNYDYCRNHVMMYVKEISTTTKIISEIEMNYEKEITINIVDMKKKFIGDSFYYVDTKFIYNNFQEKVGYISNNEYNLTDDPFILDSY